MEYELLYMINILSVIAILLTFGYHYVNLKHEKGA
jgi:hypothetical protein